MSNNNIYCAVYDFELVPYALGDVLTWCVQTSVRCIEAGRKKVDIYICVDPQYPSSIYQRDLVTSDNSFLFFNELLGVFGTHPKLSSILIFTDRNELMKSLSAAAKDDLVNTEVLTDYQNVLEKRDNEDALIEYFLKYIYSHKHINNFAEEHGGIPLLSASSGCEPDVAGVMTHLFGGKRLVVIHPRLRRLDVGYGGSHTYSRDSDFLEWYEFVRQAGTNHPNVQFVVVGRLQEKPLELLRLPNVTSLRTLGLGLGHELTLIRIADFFIGTSSGFAAMANFSEVPYFITHMNKESCKAYAIEEGAKRLPFASPNQELVYESETTDLLTSLLIRGLELPERGKPKSKLSRVKGIDVETFEKNRSRYLVPSASTNRFYLDDEYTDTETAFLLQPRIQKSIETGVKGQLDDATSVAIRVNENFPRLIGKYELLQTLYKIAELPIKTMRLMRTKIKLRSFKNRIQAKLLSINGKLMPRWMHGTIIHKTLHFAKDIVAGHKRT